VATDLLQLQINDNTLGLPISVVADSHKMKSCSWQRKVNMAKIIDFHVSQSLRPKAGHAESGRGMVIVFPRVYRLIPETVERRQITERRRHPRLGVFAMLEDSIYKVLRSAERDKAEGQETLPAANALLSPSAP
jgi:hypothetical protein